MICFICGKEGAKANLRPGIEYHYACIRCPKCGHKESYLVKRIEPPMIECLNCGFISLHLDGKWI